MHLNTRYCFRFVQRQRILYRRAGQQQRLMDYLIVSSDGLLVLPLSMPGPLPGSTTSWRVAFRSGLSGQFQRMASGEVEFRVEHEVTYLYCYPPDGKTYRIPLEVCHG